MRNSIILSAVLALVLAASGCSKTGTAAEPTVTAAPASSETATEPSLTDTSADTGDSDGKDRFTTGKIGDEYILPDAETHVYSEKELSDLSREELRLARNEIYARYGRMFKSADLELYFTNKAWYQPSIASDAFDDSLLSQTDLENLKAILKAEERLALGEISCPKIGREEYPVVDGSTATLPLSQAIYRLATGAAGQDAETHIQHSKTTQAYLNLIQGQDVDLVIAYEPGESVKNSLEQYGDNIIIKPIGYDALVFMANGKNPVVSMTQKQVQDIYMGKITNWKELGGMDLAIKAFQRPSSSGSQNLMEKLVMKGNEMVEAPQEYVFSEMEGVIAGLASYDNTGEALGYSVYYYAKNMYEKPELKFMGIDGVIPSNTTIRDGSYPYANHFYAAIRKGEPKDSQAYQLFDWLTSDDGQALINALGYVGVRDVQKALPEGFEDAEADYMGEIPLREGEVILGRGEYLYGESGIGIFDSSMRLLKFMEHVHLPEESNFFICSKDSILPMLDTQSGDFGIYSIGEDRWVVEPVYSSAYYAEDGFELRRVTWSNIEGQNRYQVSFDYADASGRLVRTGVSKEERFQKAGESGEADEPYAYSIERFVQYFPDILTRHGASADDIAIYGSEDTNFSITDKYGMTHFYDSGGNLLFDFDLSRIGEGEFAYPVVAGRHLSYLTVASNTNGKYQSHLYLYRDGVLMKELTSNANERVDAYISDIEDQFYTRTVGNYLYVYNYQDELCAKFLKGILLE